MIPSPGSIVVAAIGAASLPTLATARYGTVIVPGKEDRARVGAEQVLGVSRDAVHHCLQVECRRHVATHLGEGRTLSSAPPILVEQVGVLQRHAHHRSEGLEQADVALRERISRRSR